MRSSEDCVRKGFRVAGCGIRVSEPGGIVESLVINLAAPDDRITSPKKVYNELYGLMMSDYA